MWFTVQEERPTRGTVCGTMRSMCSADAECLAINYQSLFMVQDIEEGSCFGLQYLECRIGGGGIMV